MQKYIIMFLKDKKIKLHVHTICHTFHYSQTYLFLYHMQRDNVDSIRSVGQVIGQGPN